MHPPVISLEKSLDIGQEPVGKVNMAVYWVSNLIGLPLSLPSNSSRPSSVYRAKPLSSRQLVPYKDRQTAREVASQVLTEASRLGSRTIRSNGISGNFGRFTVCCKGRVQACEHRRCEKGCYSVQRRHVVSSHLNVLPWCKPQSRRG